MQLFSRVVIGLALLAAACSSKRSEQSEPAPAAAPISEVKAPPPLASPLSHDGACFHPCPCAADSIEKQGDAITACTLTRDAAVSGINCAAGKVMFDPTTRKLASCVSTTGFTPFASVPGQSAERMPVCAAGPVTMGPTGVTSCLLELDLLVGATGKTTLAKGTTACFTATHDAYLCAGD